jgi:rSAM/selenodomain-associated transferase 1
VVIAKAPVAGRSKTRLTPPCTPAEAALLARAALHDTLDAVAATPVARRVCVLEGEPGEWLPEGFEVIAQRGGGLDERLAHAFADVGEPAVLIGMDTPQVTPALLDECLAAVVGHGSALGLAEDGGWWAIGFTEPHPEAFAGVPMSREDTGRRQLERLRALGLQPAELPVLRDLDDAGDARAIAALVPQSRTAGAVRAHLEPDTVDVILPVLDEREAIPWVLERMPKGYRALVVDNGSTDGSAEVAAALGARVVSEPRRGFGAACYAGLAAATAPVVAFMDCDASLDPGDLPAVCDPVLDGEADLVLGARDAEAGALAAHNRLANRYLARQVKRLSGAEVSDIGPMRAARRDALLGLDLADRRSGWPLEMVLRAGLAGWRVAEVRVPYRPRVGRSKVTGTAAGTFKAVKDMRAQLARVRRTLRSSN